MKHYDIAAYIWPAYTGDEPRTRIFWPEGMGEWQSVRSAKAKFEGHSWPRRPLWGYVNEADPYVMEMEIDAAADHGVNVFIYDWYWYDRRPFLENCLNDGFLKARNRDRMKFYLMWANHDALALWDKRNADDGDTVIWGGGVDRAEFERAMTHVIRSYFTQPNYYTIEDKPVVMIYDVPKLAQGLGGIDETRRAVDWLREACVREGLPGVHLQFTMWNERFTNLSGVDGGRSVPARAFDSVGFDSCSHYQYVHYTDIDRNYEDVLPDVEKEWARLEKELPFPYFPHVSVGWDNNPRFNGFRPGILKNCTPDNIARALRMAKAYADRHPEQPPLITVNSWNEWTESSYLQPDSLYGYGYLEAIRQVFMG
ncbi:MAG: glycoside hydrolase family 99-like domain-containing protein [Clostridiales bacterium]|nr:glycoside hydrolase family 99-like domain-containing protein [Clostridiales bacterium]